ncbi:MAG: sulfatase, partial [Cyclobacteriaceae bacterium]
MKRILLIVVSIVIAAFTTSAFKFFYFTKAAEKPNIVFIIADDISWNDFGCYGNPDVQTPNIDQLAASGQIYTNTYLSASSCSPSRTSIISGRYPHNTQAAELHSPLPASLVTFPAELKKAGYYTAQAGKWHMGDSPKEGFDKIVLDVKLNGDGGEEYWVNLLKERPKDQPFFMWMAAVDAHRIWGPNQFSGTHKPEDITFIPPFLVDSINTRKDFAQYYDEVYRFDYYIGEVVKELKSQGVYDNTLILVMADNGRPFPRCKTRVYDSGMKTPFVIHWPAGIKSKGQVDALVSAIDIAPTFLQIAGLQSPESFQGKSFDKLFNNR